VGRKLGLSKDEISNIHRLSEEDFDHREYIALKYAHAFAALGGKEPPGYDHEEYRRLYPEKEQKCILSVAAKMDFINRLVATFSRKKPETVCHIKEKI